MLDFISVYYNGGMALLIRNSFSVMIIWCILGDEARSEQYSFTVNVHRNSIGAIQPILQLVPPPRNLFLAALAYTCTTTVVVHVVELLLY